MKISCIITVFNEQKTITQLLDSLYKQTLPADEIIIVDGGSTDRTVDIISSYQIPEKATSQVKIQLFEKKGNRSVGRNEAIRHATGEIIVCTDAGCIPEIHWIEDLTKPFEDESIDVVAGYYESKSETYFQECLVPYVFIMPDKIKPAEFLPASRNMAFKKAIWEKAGGFPEEYSHNEDYVFAHTLRNMGAKTWFEKEAIVYWIPRKTFRGAFVMFYRFAYGDAESGLHRPKVMLVFARYLFGFLLLLFSIYMQSLILLGFCIIIFICYLIWAIIKNYRYIDDEQAVVYLPAIQLTADAAVMAGSIAGFLHRIWATKKKQ